jgi:hypothetical protein
LPAGCERRVALAMAGMPPVAANFGVGSWIERRARTPRFRWRLWVTSARSPLWSWPSGSVPGQWPAWAWGVCMARIQGLSCPTTCLQGRELNGPYGCRAVAAVDFVAVPSG